MWYPQQLSSFNHLAGMRDDKTVKEIWEAVWNKKKERKTVKNGEPGIGTDP